VRNPHEDKYILIIEKVNKAFLRTLFKKEYGYFPHLYPTERLSDTLGSKSLQIRRNLSLLRFVFQLRQRTHRTEYANPRAIRYINSIITDDIDFDVFRVKEEKTAIASSYLSKQFSSNELEGEW
jgi:hypothetical protein